MNKEQWNIHRETENKSGTPSIFSLVELVVRVYSTAFIPSTACHALYPVSRSAPQLFGFDFELDIDGPQCLDFDSGIFARKSFLNRRLTSGVLLNPRMLQSLLKGNPVGRIVLEILADEVSGVG